MRRFINTNIRGEDTIDFLLKWAFHFAELLDALIGILSMGMLCGSFAMELVGYRTMRSCKKRMSKRSAE